jgi:hypothetical protein
VVYVQGVFLMMYCNNPKCDFECEDGKVPMSCPKCKRGSFGRPKGYDPYRTVHYGTIAFPGGYLSVYQTYLDLNRPIWI